MATKEQAILQVLGINIEGEEMTPEKINEVFRNLKAIKKTIEGYEKNTLKPFLFQSAETFGMATDNGGNKVVLPDGTGWEKQARVSVTVDNDKALELLKEKGLTEYIDTTEHIVEDETGTVIDLLKAIGREELVEQREATNEGYLEQAFLAEAITDDELAALIERKTTFALVEVKPPKPGKKPLGTPLK